ncbi:AAA family ATPase [Flavobacterium sp.]|uniref:phosphatase domain-containing protein n=1 Tax=Flavobacterium sp. TaxID=239 RepID=UPI00286E0745|nr:AAA family ATPase [Flavobacterium sp.]
MRKVILMKGLPRSGKSTYAKALIDSNPETYKRINRDELRAMFDNAKTSQENEKFIKKVLDLLITHALEKGKSVVVDDTNLSDKNYNRISQLVREYNLKFLENVVVEIKEMNTPIEVCIERDAFRENPVGAKVIKKMNNQFFKDSPEYALQNQDLPKAIICDLDGTLALMNGRNPFDASKCDQDLLNEPVANVLKNYKQLGYKILLVSGREDQYKAPTLRFLEKYAIEFDDLIMRKSRDNRKDSIIKIEIYNNFIKDKYFVEFVLDDRNQVVDTWRNDLKLPCFQVYYGDF